MVDRRADLAMYIKTITKGIFAHTSEIQGLTRATIIGFAKVHIADFVANVLGGKLAKGETKTGVMLLVAIDVVFRTTDRHRHIGVFGLCRDGCNRSATHQCSDKQFFHYDFLLKNSKT